MAEFLYGYPAEELADLTGVHVATARRWKRGDALPPVADRLLRLVLTGDLGLISRAWRGWRLAAGTLVGPDGITATPGEVLAIPFVRAQVSAYQARQRFATQADWVDGRYVDGAESSALAESAALGSRR
jgi:hypothetical protein